MGSSPLPRYVDEFVDFLTGNVNPQELGASPAFFDKLVRNLPKQAILVKLAIAVDNYDPRSAEKRIRPQPDVCALYSSADLERQKAKEEEAIELHRILATTRVKVQAPIGEVLGACGALDALRLWERSAVRLWVGKPALPEFVNLACAKGKYSGTCRLGGVPPRLALMPTGAGPLPPIGGAPPAPGPPAPTLRPGPDWCRPVAGLSRLA